MKILHVFDIFNTAILSVKMNQRYIIAVLEMEMFVFNIENLRAPPLSFECFKSEGLLALSSINVIAYKHHVDGMIILRNLVTSERIEFSAHKNVKLTTIEFNE